ncbi:TPA: hypothetical protein N0F65_000601, partial [Lagenidium giganteum]
MGFSRARVDYGIYHMHREGSPIFLSVYVDDVLIEGPLTHLLALEVNVSQQQITLSQSSYVSKLLKRFNMEDAFPRYTPVLDTEIPVKPPKPYGPDVNRRDISYREPVGSLQYLVRCTRPNLANGV